MTWCFYVLSSQVVFNQAQIRMFTYDQAVAVTEAQRSALSTVQADGPVHGAQPLGGQTCWFQRQNSFLIL